MDSSRSSMQKNTCAGGRPFACDAPSVKDRYLRWLAKPRRISESSLKAERLREFRAKDPALDTAADALDLEIVD